MFFFCFVFQTSPTKTIKGLLAFLFQPFCGLRQKKGAGMDTSTTFSGDLSRPDIRWKTPRDDAIKTDSNRQILGTALSFVVPFHFLWLSSDVKFIDEHLWHVHLRLFLSLRLGFSFVDDHNMVKKRKASWYFYDLCRSGLRKEKN